MSKREISRNVAMEATEKILEEFFWPYPDPQYQIVGCRLMRIIDAAAWAGLTIYGNQILEPSRN